MHKGRLEALFKSKKIDAIISESSQTRRWFSKVATTDGWLIIEKEKSTLFIDGRYFEYAKKHAKNVDLILLEKDSLKNFLKNKEYKKVAIESDYLSVQNFEKTKSLFPNLSSKDFVLINAQELRIIKTEDEINLIQKAIDISLEALSKVKEYLQEGITELEIDHKLNYLMKRLGADKEGFENIVAFAENTAMPHHHPTDKKLKKGDIVKIDFGAQYKGYTADITRTFIFEDEENPNTTHPKLREILQIVEEAAKAGRDAVKPGIKASEIDLICRQYIQDKGYGQYFVHGTGHGIGLDVHEFPSVSFKSDVVLEEGMCLTVEPGIYIEGLGGARIEDDLLVTKEGHKVLSRK